jgi:ribonuclease G
MKTRPNENAEKTILIDVNPYRTRVALLENGLPVEFYFERRDKKRLVGNIYKGWVQNVLPGMFASFIEINEERNAFLYAGDIKPGNGLLEGEQIEGEMTPSMICDIIRVGQDIMVQIVKEPIGTKGARASTQISLPGRTLVFMPTVDFIGISKRISDDAERKRLKKIVSEMLPEGTGVIVRTAAEGLDEDLIKQDLNSLLEEWEQINRRFSSGKAPCLIHKEGSLLFRTARDMLGGNVKSVMINDRVQYDLLCRIADPAIKDRIELNESAGDLFAYMNIDGALDAALSRKVWLKSGAYIVKAQT